MYDYFCLNTTYKIATKINVGNCCLTTNLQKCNDFSSTKTMKDSNVTKTIKHFRLKIKTKTKSKMPAKMNTASDLSRSLS